MRVAVEKMPGVDSAAVSLNEGEVEVDLAERNDVTLEGLRDVIRNQGFTPREADIRVRGTAVPGEEGVWRFSVAGSDAVFRLVAEPPVLEELERREGQDVILRGRVAGETPGQLEVEAVDAVGRTRTRRACPPVPDPD